MQYEVIIEETVSQTVTVEAASAEEATAKVERAYKKGDVVLEPGALIGVDIYAAAPSSMKPPAAIK